MDRSGDHGQHVSEVEWAEMSAHLELEGEVLLPYVTESASCVAQLCRLDGFEVRRVLDVGSGPGVGT